MDKIWIDVSQMKIQGPISSWRNATQRMGTEITWHILIAYYFTYTRMTITEETVQVLVRM